jgi:hypothetical protein
MKRTPLTRKTGLKRTGRINPRSDKTIARDADLEVARKAVVKRAGGRCEAQWDSTCRRYGAHAHHVIRRSQGGDHDPGNLIWVCNPCHENIHRNPAEARKLGLLARPTHTNREDNDNES